MPEEGVRSTYSQCPFQIYMCDNVGVISTGTAFFYLFNNESFLITNWHNVTGRNFLTKEPLPIQGSSRFPEFLKIKISTYINETQFTTITHDLPLYLKEGNLIIPNWYEHPEFKSDCDVVAIPFKKPSTTPDFMHNYANRISDTKIPIKPGNTVFIIGYPSSISTGFGLPIWKSGYIASEPHYKITIGGKITDIGGLAGGINLPAFFIDSLTRKGMSGSPVFSIFVGTWDLKNPYSEIDVNAPNFWTRDDVALSAVATQFIGIYSGSVPDKENDAALGLCWGEQVIIDICSSRITADNPHVSNS